MPFELTAHEPFTDRLPDNRVKIWKAGEDVTDPADVARLFGNPFFVKRWIDEPAPEPKGEAKADPKPASDAPDHDAASALSSSPTPAPSDPALEPKPAS